MCWKVALFFSFSLQCACVAISNHKDTSLRELLQNYQQNQDLIERLGTRYEIVYPVHIRQDWVQGLSTKVSTLNNTVSHLQQTSFVIETVQDKLYLDLQLNTNLFAPTLVQFLYLLDSHVIIDKFPENCYYHATVRNHSESSAAFQTCKGLSGVIYLADKVLIIFPLHGSDSINHPHLLYHYLPKDNFECANSDISGALPENSMSYSGTEVAAKKKFIELALVIDQTLFDNQNASPKETIASAIQIINCVDLLYRSLNTSISLVYLELWIKDQVVMESDAKKSLNSFAEYAARRFNRISVDAAHMLTGFSFNNNKSGIAAPDSICTAKAIGITMVKHAFEPHLSSYALAHMIGHNLGMDHDHSRCDCNRNCIMTNNARFLQSVHFSNCSIGGYYKTLSRGYGACLFNMPTMRMSVCGNGILEKEEQCDCGTSDECMKLDSCCDPMTCKFIKHAQCSSGSCCKKCKLLSPDHLCRPIKGECDIPEFCDGQTGQCPVDLYKKNGVICYGGIGYCFQGLCPVMKSQCQDNWGEKAEPADTICFERLNVLGTPNGNCGTDSRGSVIKCSIANSYCGSLQCSQGEKVPINEEKPVQFVINKINSKGVIHECKAKYNSVYSAGSNQGLVKDGTKCGYQKFCVNQTCMSVKNIVSGRCPSKVLRVECSGHGVCTNINTCYCEEGWKGSDCNEIDEQSKMKPKDEYYDSIEDSNPPDFGQNVVKVNANLAFIVIAACVVIGLGLVVTVVLILLYSQNRLNANCRKNYGYK